MAVINLETVLENPIVRICWDPALKSVELEAKRDATSSEFRAAMELLMRVLNEKGARKLLADVGKLSTVTPEDLIWTMDWSHRLTMTLVKFLAIVLPKSLGLHMSLVKMAQGGETKAAGQNMRFFGDAEAARNWLRAQ